MSERKNGIIAVSAIVLLGIGFFLVGNGLFLLLFPGTTTTTPTATTSPTSTNPTTSQTTTTTTTTTPTTTTTTAVLPHPLHVLTRMDVLIQNIFELAFLDSEYALENNITDIIWNTPDFAFWDDLIDLGQADVCWGGRPTEYDELMLSGGLSPLTSPLMQDVSSRVNDTIADCPMKGNNTGGELVWIASRLSTYGFTINHDFLDYYLLPSPISWDNLTLPVYGKNLTLTPVIALSNALDSSVYSALYDFMLQKLGWDSGWIYLAKLASSSYIYSGSIEAQQAVQLGNAGICLSSLAYGLQSQKENPDCEYIVPTDGIIVQGDPIAIASNSPQKSSAEAFIDFVLSPYGQSLLLDPSVLSLPVIREAFDEPGIIGAEEIYRIFNDTVRSSTFGTNASQSLLTRVSLMDYFDSVIADAHGELSSCWKTIVEAFYAGNITSSELQSYAVAMGTPVSIVDPLTSTFEKFTLEYAIKINANLTYDTTYRSAVKVRWTNEAKIQYLTIQTNLESLYPWLMSFGSYSWIFDEGIQTSWVLLLGFSSLIVLMFVRSKYT